MGRVLAFVERDLRKFTRNPVIIFSSVCLPMVYLLVLGNSFQGTVKNLPLAVIDQDHGPYAKRMIERIHSIEAGPGTLEYMMMVDAGQAEADVRSGRLKGALIIPPDFSKSVSRGTSPQVGLIIDNTDAISTAALQRVLTEAFTYLKVDAIAVRPDRRIPQLRTLELYRKLDYDASIVPGAVIMAIFMGTMTTGAFSVVMDRFQGVHEAYLSTPLTRGELTLAILISGVFVTTLIALIVLGTGIRLTGLEVASGLSAYLAIVMVIMLSSMGLLSMMCFLLARVDHPRIVGIFGGFLNIILFFPSGAVYPIESFPPWLRTFSKVNPESYAVHALKSILFKGMNWSAVQDDLIFLSGFTIVMYSLATLNFKRTL